MRTRNLALKVTLNSVYVILIAFTLIQLINYSRDAILFQTGSIGEFFANYAVYMGTRVIPVLVLFSIIIFLNARKMEQVLGRLERGEPTEQEELEAVRARILRFPSLIVLINVIGFSTGFLLDHIIGGRVDEIFRFDDIARLLFNISSGVVYANAQNSLNNIVMRSSRELLLIETLDKQKREAGILRRSVVLTLFFALYTSLFLYNNNSYLVRQEMIYSDLLTAKDQHVILLTLYYSFA